MAVSKTQTLQQYLEGFRESGSDLGVFPSSSSNRFVLRVIDPDEPETGYTYVASFSKKSFATEATVPSDAKKARKASIALDELLHDAKRCSQLVACFCIIDDESVEKGFAKEEQLGQTFVSVAKPQTATSLSYGDADEAEAEAKVKTVTKGKDKNK